MASRGGEGDDDAEDVEAHAAEVDGRRLAGVGHEGGEVAEDRLHLFADVAVLVAHLEDKSVDTLAVAVDLIAQPLPRQLGETDALGLAQDAQLHRDAHQRLHRRGVERRFIVLLELALRQPRGLSVDVERPPLDLVAREIEAGEEDRQPRAHRVGSVGVLEEGGEVRELRHERDPDAEVRRRGGAVRR